MDLLSVLRLVGTLGSLGETLITEDRPATDAEIAAAFSRADVADDKWKAWVTAANLTSGDDDPDTPVQPTPDQ